VRVDAAMVATSALRPERVRDVDLLVVRELTGGLYFSKPKRRYQTPRGEAAVDTMRYSTPEIERVAVRAFELARMRRRRLLSVDKANVLETSRLWRVVVTRVAERYPDVACSHMLVDAFAMELLRRPQAFDVIVTENLFGDILTDEASMLAGGRSDSTNRFMGRRPTSPGKGSRIRSAPSSARRSSCGGRSTMRLRPRRWSGRSPVCWPPACGPRISRAPARRP
jgi:3-isopropylmalate dehydrogenase